MRNVFIFRCFRKISYRKNESTHKFYSLKHFELAAKGDRHYSPWVNDHKKSSDAESVEQIVKIVPRLQRAIGLFAASAILDGL